MPLVADHCTVHGDLWPCRESYGCTRIEPTGDEAPCPYCLPPSASTVLHRGVAVFIGLVVLLSVLGILMFGGQRAAAHIGRQWSSPVKSGWYGPGLYGRTTACGQRLTPHTRGVAHRRLPCGTLVLLRSHGRIVAARVIDRGPYVPGREFDLTGRTAQQLCACQRSSTPIRHRWRLA